MRREDYAVPRVGHAQAVIDVGESAHLSIESTNAVVDGPTRHEALPADGRIVASRNRCPEVSQRRLRIPMEGGRGDPVHAQENADMLERSVWIMQLRSNGADRRSLRKFEECGQPFAVDRLQSPIQEKQVIALC